jgi:hypothetical protein
MIIKGSSRGQSAADVKRLGDHLLDLRGNETVRVIELRGVVAGTLPDALAEMRALSMATRTRRPLYSASISPTEDEARRMTERHWIEAADALERELGLSGHQRALVRHDKKGRGHLHIVWNRVDGDTLKVAHDGWSYLRHERVARRLEQRWRLKPVIGAHTRPEGIARPVAAMSHQDWQAQTRTGVAVADVADRLRQAWHASPDGRSFAVAVHLAGLTLARGRRGVIVLDAAGTPHSLARRLGLKAAEVRQKLADLDLSTLASIDGAKPSPPERITTMTKKSPRQFAAAAQIRRRKGSAPETATPPDPAHWTALGYAFEIVAGLLLVTLPGGLTLEDRGDQLILRGTPTPDATKLMVEAAKARGWQGIHFSGGDEAWQRAARIEAIRQGFDPAAITLACEENKPPVMAAMPDHIRRRLGHKPPEDAPSPETPVAPEPETPGYRP